MASPRNDRLPRHAGDGLIGLEAIATLLADTALHVGLVRDALARAYGERSPGPALDPLSELVLTILSQHTTDVNSHRAYTRLREQFPTWEQVMAAPVQDVELAIRGGGLARQKAPRIEEHPAPGAGTGRASLAR